MVKFQETVPYGGILVDKIENFYAENYFLIGLEVFFYKVIIFAKKF